MPAPEGADDLDNLKTRLAERWQDLCLVLFGEPAHRGRREWRWGRKGSMAVKLGGRYGLSFSSYESDEGGSLLDAIMVAHGCGFREAVDWARAWLGGEGESTSRPRPQAPRAAFDADAEEERGKAEALALWRAGRGIYGTAASRYLQGRKIDRWPAECVRLIAARDVGRIATSLGDDDTHKPWSWWRWPALVFPMMNGAGAVTAVQLVALTDDGDAVLRSSGGGKWKINRGSAVGSAVQLPADSDAAGPLVLAEGGETALSVWAATGFETWAAMGGVGKAPLEGVPFDRLIVVCRDDDPPGSPAFKARAKAVRAWRKAGRRVVEVSPWPTSRGDKSDFNDLLQAEGPDAVRLRLDAAIAPATPKPRPSVEVARATLAVAMKTATADLLAWREDNGKPAPFSVLAVGVGIGKSDAALDAVLDAYEARRRPVYVAPTHALNAELATRLREKAAARGLAPLIEIYRGATADDPASPGEKMCTSPALYEKAVHALARPLDTVCRVCPKREDCAFVRQQGLMADIWLAATDVIFRKPPRPIGKPDFLIVDENFALRGLAGVDGPLRLVTHTMIEQPIEHGTSRPALTADLQAALTESRRMLATLIAGAAGPLDRSSARAAGLTRDICRRASDSEWQRRRDVPDWDLEPDQMRAALESAKENQSVKSMARLWRDLADLVSDAGPEWSGRIVRWSSNNDGVIDSFRLVWAERIAPDWQVPTLHIDATANMTLIKERAGRHARLVATAEADTPHMHVTQLTGSFGQWALADERGKHLDRVWSWILATAREKGGRWLVVSNKGVEDRIRAGHEIPVFVELAHFNALRGLDTYGDVRGIVVLGRPMPSTADVEMIRGALSGWATPKPLAGAYYPLKTTTITGRDGSALSVDAEVHPDALAEAVRAAVCEAEIVQAIGRGRGVNRTIDSPLSVYVLGNVPLTGLMPDAVDRWEPLGPDGEHFAREGIQLENVRDMSRLMGDADPERLKDARRRRRSGSFPIEKPSSIIIWDFSPTSGAQAPGARLGAYSVKQNGRRGNALSLSRTTKDVGSLHDQLRKALPPEATLTAVHDPWAPGWGAIRCQVTGALNFGLAPTQQRPHGELQ